MTKLIVAPTNLPSNDVDTDGKQRHDAFGKVKIVKSSYGGAGTQLFGSELRHHHVITVTIDRATTSRRHHGNNMQEDGHIVEFSMSESQWAQMVSSQGMYGGTPITLNYAPERGTPVKQMPGIVLEGFIKTFGKEIKAQTAKDFAAIAEGIAKLNAIIESPGGMSKKDMRALMHTLTCQVQNMPSNMQFIQDRLHEALDKTVSDGKIELEAFVGNMAKQIGMEHLGLTAPSFNADTPTLTYNPATPDAIQIAEQQAMADEAPLSPYHCKECGEPQYDTPSGYVCKNGHGGADGYIKETP